MQQVLPQPPPSCKPPVALPAPSGKGAMLVDAASGRLEWVQPSGASSLSPGAPRSMKCNHARVAVDV